MVKINYNCVVCGRDTRLPVTDIAPAFKCKYCTSDGELDLDNPDIVDNLYKEMQEIEKQALLRRFKGLYGDDA